MNKKILTFCGFRCDLAPHMSTTLRKKLIGQRFEKDETTILDLIFLKNVSLVQDVIKNDII
jgi:hypothetical protein